MLAQVAKEFRWEMGHRLPDHPLCRNVHGHSYRLVVEIEGEVGDDGMVVDFGEIAQIVKPLVDRLDHSFALDPSDEVMRGFLRDEGHRTAELPFLSTAENLAGHFAEALWQSLASRKGVSAVRATVYETPSSSATVQVRRP
ncbi:MAG: 6-carboxytetrahydropterin synthase [Fimbriimonadaceae bacterium]|nr:6-carboxytetrahydropterin synthase [Fimbriimonadaceae bacterium]